MPIRPTFVAALLCTPLVFSTSGCANSRVPLPAGRTVTVTAGARTVTGTLLDGDGAGWVRIEEAGSGQTVLIPMAAVDTLREVQISAAPDTGAAAPPDARPTTRPTARPEAGVAEARRKALDVKLDADTFRRVTSPERARATSSRAMAVQPAAGPAGLWKLRSKHLVFGMPRQTDNRHNVTLTGISGPQPGISVLVKEGWVIGHYDRFKVPAWVSTRWTRDDLEVTESMPSLGRPFKPDDELPEYAQAQKNYDFATSNMERGHMARHEDNKAWGTDSSEVGCLMSNIVPQHKDMNGEAWLDIEDAHRNVVANDSLNIDTVWVISGPIFKNNQAESLVGNEVGVPEATFKVIGWFDSAGEFHARGYIVKQGDRVRNPAHYLKPIDQIEQATGLDFFPELDDPREDQIEAATTTDLWGN